MHEEEKSSSAMLSPRLVAHASKYSIGPTYRPVWLLLKLDGQTLVFANIGALNDAMESNILKLNN